MNLSAVIHESTVPYRQPIARNRIHYRLLTAESDCSTCTLYYWKRSKPYPQSRAAVSLNPRYSDGIHTEWTCDVVFAEETHYIKYFFGLSDALGEVIYYCEHGFSKEVPEHGFFELLQANETDVPALPEWSCGIVYYQIFPERFAIGNPDKALHQYVPWDSAPARENFFGGDINGIRAKIQYLRALGVECLFLTPVFAGDFNHKYATTDYFTVDPDFGTNEDLVALVQEAHAGGIRVILDGVFNHVGVHFAPFADLLTNGEA
ncbi:MAG: alpha amylase N-terminal ig-like domain-containing protein, partial [Eubacteriales bacterium]|nr:alpha amylase N-terminal ig-like domain-containing protein [Eubacteriales bacterium]